MIKKFLNGLFGRDPTDARIDSAPKQDAVLPCIGDLIPVSAVIDRLVPSQFSNLDTYEKIATKVREFVPFDRIAISILDFEQETFRRAFVSGRELVGIEQGNVFALRNSFPSEVATSRRAIRPNPLARYPDQENFVRSGLLSRIATPLISNDAVIGVLHLASAKTNAYVEQDLISLENVGNEIAGAIYNLALLQAEQDRSSQLEALFSVSAILAQSQTFDVKAQAIVETLVRIADADQAIVRRADEGRDNLDLVATAGSGVLRFEPTLSISDRHSATGKAFREGRILLIDDYQKTPDAPAAMQAQGVASVLMMPITCRGQALGVLSVISKTVNHFDPECVALLTAFADEIGIVFDTAELTDSLQASREEMATANEIARIITATLEIEEVYEQFAVEAKKLVEFDRVTIGVINHSDATITIKYSFGPVVAGYELGQLLPMDERNNLAALANGQPVFVDDLTTDSKSSLDEECRLSGLRSSAVVPLISKGRAIGSLGFHSVTPSVYGLKEQAIITRLANLIAPAVQNAELYADRVRAEEALQASAARAQAVMDTAADGIITINHKGLIETFNPAAEVIFGYQTREVVGKNVSLLMPEPDQGTHYGYISRYLAAGENQVIGTGREEAGRRKDGTNFPMDFSIGVIEIGNTKCFTVIIRDVTERKRTEARLNESSRLASVGELAAGVAHEINNPLAVIILASEFLSNIELSVEARHDLNTISESAHRAARIVENMLLFARKTDPKPEQMTIDLVVKHALELKAHDFRRKKIESFVNVEEGLPNCLIDRQQMGQVLINILNNAEHAMATTHGGGRITIDIRSTSDFVILEVRDDGPGMEPEVLIKIFEPFFTTKAAGEGTGLGLSICYGIVQQHGGAMWAENRNGSGTSFFVQLPVVGDQPGPQSTPCRPNKITVGSISRLLIVDDEPVIRELLTKGLSDHVNTIDQAPNGAAALEMMRDSNYDCILLDLKLPMISGVEVFETIVDFDPSIADRFVFITGDTANSDYASFLAGISNPVLGKPFTLDEVIKKIESVLSTGSDR